MTKQRFHQILRRRSTRPAMCLPRPAYAVFPRGVWDVSGARGGRA